MLAIEASLLFRCSESVSRHSEGSLFCDNLTCELVVEILCGYYNVCLLRIDSLTIWWLMYMLLRLHKHTLVTLPMRAWIVIWCRGTGLYANCIDWLQHHNVGLLEIGWHDKWGQYDCVLDRTYLYAPCCWIAGKTRSAQLRVSSDVSICTMSLGCMTDEVSTVAY